jgi:hypothetical protein
MKVQKEAPMKKISRQNLIQKEQGDKSIPPSSQLGLMAASGVLPILLLLL